MAELRKLLETAGMVIMLLAIFESVHAQNVANAVAFLVGSFVYVLSRHSREPNR